MLYFSANIAVFGILRVGGSSTRIPLILVSLYTGAREEVSFFGCVRGFYIFSPALLSDVIYVHKYNSWENNVDGE